MMFRLGHSVDGDWVEHVYPPVYRINEKGDRITATIPHGDPSIFRALALASEPPHLLLYVLHTPRGEGEAGRYQSPELSNEAVADFIDKYAAFLRQDGRFDLWIHAPRASTTIVWDRHNLLHAYGDAERFGERLGELGYRAGEIVVPYPHEHHYHMELDDMAQGLLDDVDWYRTPLRPEDEQRLDG
ncbi:hypothetical protein GGR25_004035 [Kaistia hirudinis]|uniref:Uncharacterized protein n=1 Tax=Kaistia hirudinis TaxID=1293440 RepID=A0A840AW04_9HYPH|nr:hypothetical protein [Kaistia hirudinis]MBB3932971.1 hypothetical protein [Kaistia hirudinis]